jgi:hypothetical protein
MKVPEESPEPAAEETNCVHLPIEFKKGKSARNEQDKNHL